MALYEAFREYWHIGTHKISDLWVYIYIIFIYRKPHNLRNKYTNHNEKDMTTPNISMFTTNFSSSNAWQCMQIKNYNIKLYSDHLARKDLACLPSLEFAPHTLCLCVGATPNLWDWLGEGLQSQTNNGSLHEPGFVEIKSFENIINLHQQTLLSTQTKYYFNNFQFWESLSEWESALKNICTFTCM